MALPTDHYGSFTFVPLLDSDARWRAWGAGINSLIASTGWVKASDTGQVNWATSTLPATGAANAVYEIWKCNDSLQATDPIFIKLKYYHVSNAPMLTAGAGTGSNGTGTLTSAPNTNVSVSTEYNSHGIGAPTATPLATCYVSGDESSLFISFGNAWNGVFTNGGIFGVERNRLHDGSAGNMAFGLSWSNTAAQSALQSVYIHNLWAQPGAAAGMGWGFCNANYPGGKNFSGASSLIAGQSWAIPCFTAAAPRFGAPSRFLVAVNPADNPVGSTFTINHYGASHQFVVVRALGFEITGAAYNAALAIS